MAKMVSLVKHLQSLEKEDLITEIELICKKFPDVKKYFQVEISGDTSKLLEIAIKKISAEFFGANRRRRPKMGKINAYIKDFEKFSLYNEDLLKLMLHRLEVQKEWIEIGGFCTDTILGNFKTAVQKAKDLLDKEGIGHEHLELIERHENFINSYR